MKAEVIECYVGLGSNLDEPAQQVERALAALDSLAQTEVVDRSSLYGSAPMGPSDQPDYVNAVAALKTLLGPIELFKELQGIERVFGRDRAIERWGPRVIDLDLLLFGRLAIKDQQLTIPHPGLLERAFVVRPLLELNPRVRLPDGAFVKDVCGQFEANSTWIVKDARPLSVSHEQR